MAAHGALEKRKRPRPEDLLPDQISLKKPKSSDVCPRQSEDQNQKTRPDNPLQDQVPATNTHPNSVFPEPSRPQNDLLQDQVPLKKSKSSGAAHRPSNFPPEFYDNLSKVWLTPRALRELNRRNEGLYLPTRTVDQIYIEDLPLAARKGGSDLARFARTGGPDLRDLHGWPEAIIAHTVASTTSPVTRTRVSADSGQTKSTRPTNATSKSRRSSAYDANFEQHLIDHNIYPPLYDFPDNRRNPKPANWEEIRQAIKAPRGSLSPSLIPESTFEGFQRKNHTKSKGILMRDVVPLLTGNASISNKGHLRFANLDSLTNNTTVNPAPDFFDGAHAGDLDKEVREDLDKIIIPLKRAGVPIAPNFFLEVKSSMGTMDVAVGQAVLDGAHGAHIMHALQNYLVDEPIYDGNAYAFTSTLLDGYLKLFAHHLTAPAKSGQRPEYHTTQLTAYALTGDDDFWLEGTGVFRNLRQFAKDWRYRFIKDANARSRRHIAAAAATEDDLASKDKEQQMGGSSPVDLNDCQVSAEPENDDDGAQETQETCIGLAILDQPTSKSDADVEVVTDFAASFASSFTSVSHQDALPFQLPPKVPRTPPSHSSARAKKR